MINKIVKKHSLNYFKRTYKLKINLLALSLNEEGILSFFYYELLN